MRSQSGVASIAFKILAENNINIQMISTSEIKITLVISLKDMNLAVKSLHVAFNL